MVMRRTPSVQHPATILKGGLDQITPALSLRAGHVVDAINFECAVQGGYSRVKGYQRYDGQTALDNAAYQVVSTTTLTQTLIVGNGIGGQTSAANGLIIDVGNGYVVVGLTTPATFIVGENIIFSLAVIGQVTAVAVKVSAKNNAIYLAGAAEVVRGLIKKVGNTNGLGPVRGAFVLNNNVYAFRDDLNGILSNLWKATLAGWVLVEPTKSFTYNTSVGTGIGGAIPPSEGETFTQTSTGATGIVKRVMQEIGAWKTAATATADAGRLVFQQTSVADVFLGNAVTFSGGATAFVTSAGALQARLAGGKYEFVLANFAGAAQSNRIYGVDGINKPFEFDSVDNVYCQIDLKISGVQAKHIAYHLKYLMVSIGSSIVFSEVGLPYRFTTGGQIATGDVVTGLQALPGTQSSGALAVAGPNNIQILYGNTPANFNLTYFNENAGVINYTMQNFNDVLLFNENGIGTLTTTLKYGNFSAASLTEKIKTFVKDNVTKVAYSVLCREKNQYRIFFTNGYALYLTLSKESEKGVMPIYFPSPVYCAHQARLNDRSEIVLIGSEDGYVYQMEKGTSFDGAPIPAYMDFAWDHNGSPRIEKSYQHATIEMTSQTFASIGFTYQLGYGSDEYAESVIVDTGSPFQGTYRWDQFQWDAFVWDGRSLLPTEVDMDGTAENVKISLASETNYIDSFTINSYILSLINRRAKR